MNFKRVEPGLYVFDQVNSRVVCFQPQLPLRIVDVQVTPQEVDIDYVQIVNIIATAWTREQPIALPVHGIRIVLKLTRTPWESGWVKEPLIPQNTRIVVRGIEYENLR